MRAVLGVIAGVVVALIFAQAAEMIVHQLHPFPPGTDTHDTDTITRYVATLPPATLLLVLGGWLVGTLVGTFAAAKIGRSRVPAYIVSALLLCGGIASATMIRQPVWFTAVLLAIFIAVPFAGIAIAKPPQPATA